MLLRGRSRFSSKADSCCRASAAGARGAVSFARHPFEESFLAKPNYSFEKRQREIARKKKQDEKRQRKQRAPDEPAPVEQQSQPTPPDSETAA